MLIYHDSTTPLLSVSGITDTNSNGSLGIDVLSMDNVLNADAMPMDIDSVVPEFSSSEFTDITITPELGSSAAHATDLFVPDALIGCHQVMNTARLLHEQVEALEKRQDDTRERCRAKRRRVEELENSLSSLRSESLARTIPEGGRANPVMRGLDSGARVSESADYTGTIDMSTDIPTCESPASLATGQPFSTVSSFPPDDEIRMKYVTLPSSCSFPPAYEYISPSLIGNDSDYGMRWTSTAGNLNHQRSSSDLDEDDDSSTIVLDRPSPTVSSLVHMAATRMDEDLLRRLSATPGFGAGLGLGLDLNKSAPGLGAGTWPATSSLGGDLQSAHGSSITPSKSKSIRFGTSTYIAPDKRGPTKTRSSPKPASSFTRRLKLKRSLNLSKTFRSLGRKRVLSMTNMRTTTSTSSGVLTASVSGSVVPKNVKSLRGSSTLRSLVNATVRTRSNPKPLLDVDKDGHNVKGGNKLAPAGVREEGKENLPALPFKSKTRASAGKTSSILDGTLFQGGTPLQRCMTPEPRTLGQVHGRD